MINSNNYIVKYSKLAQEIVKKSYGQVQYKPKDKVKIINPNRLDYGKIKTIDRCNHYNNQYWIGYSRYSINELELVVSYNWNR